MTTKFTVKTIVMLLFLSVIISCKDSVNTTSTSTESPTSSTVQDADSYTSKMTKSDKKKYFDSNNNVVFEIKYKPDGFKLRTASSDLLWKVKLYDDKIKISDNEENLNPYEIKIMDTYEAKLMKNDNMLARTSYDLESKEQSIASEGDEQPVFFKTSYSPSLLVNNISEISVNQKKILIKELTAKGY